MTAVTLLPVPPLAQPGAGVGRLCGYNIVVLLFSCVWFLNRSTRGLLVGNHIVDASSDRVGVV